jgi:putative peptide zinc metalloprotease protein
MVETNWKLRSDLEIRPESGSGVIVKDPITRRFYRFTPVQAAVLELLNGQLDLVSIAGRVTQKHQTEVLESQLTAFIGKLRELLLLDHAYCWAKLKDWRGNKAGVIRNLLYIKILAFNPDDLLTKLEKKFRFCYTPVFRAVAWSAVAISLVLTVLNWESLFVSLGDLISIYSVPLVVVVVFVLMTVHEFAHGITLKHFGGRVEEMGLLVLYFIPAFYCNVSDAWMLKKRERIWVTLAGGYIQVLLWAMATIVWRLLETDSMAGRVCLIAIAFTGIQTLLNFNPLIRLDGYYLLSDYMEVSNLRPKALTYVKNRFKTTLAGVSFENESELSLREKRIFLYYGIASSLFTAGLVLIMIQRLGGWLVREYHSWGILLACTLFIMTVPIANKEGAAATGTFLKTVLARLRKTPKAIIALAIVVAAGFLPWELKISGDFTVIPLNRVYVTPQVAGNLKAIYVDQGNRVHAGDLLAEIENLALSNNYQATRGELAAQRATLDLLLAGSRPEEIERARKLVETKNAELYNATRIEQERAVLLETIAKKDAELANARLNHERTQRLLASGLIAGNEADRDRTAYEVQQKELSEARGRVKILEEQTDRNQDIKRKELAQAESELKLLLAGSRKESIRAVKAQVEKLEEQLRIFEREMGLLKIRSPIEGVVATAYLHNRIGDYLDKGDVFCELVSEGTVIMEMPVPEKEIGDVVLGLPITIKVRGYPKRWYQARVRSIAPVAATNSPERTVVVQGELDNPDGSLKAGMTGVGKILCGRKRVMEIATRRAIRWLRTEFWEYLP